MERYYSIAGSVIRVTCDTDIHIAMFDGFEAEPTSEYILDAQLMGTDDTCRCYGVSYLPSHPGYPHLLLPEHGNGLRSRIYASEDWSKLRIYGDPDGSKAWMEMLVAAFYSRLTAMGGLLMHASAVEYQGKAVVFTAASGTGKTTQAENWHRYLDASILNGDKVFLRKEETDGDIRIDAWGSPWAGSSPYAVNACAPVQGIVVLAQGSKNIIRKLDAFELLGMFPTHVFYPGWDQRCVDQMMEVLDAVISTVPVYYLSCRPDEEAVLLTHDTLWADEKVAPTHDTLYTENDE